MSLLWNRDPAGRAASGLGQDCGAKVKKEAKISACRDFVWCKAIEERTVNGIVVPDSAQDINNPREGLVVAVGTGLIEGGVEIPLKVKVGDHIYFPKASGTMVFIKETDEMFFVLRENQVFGSVTP